MSILLMDIMKITPAFTDERGSIWDFITNDNIHHIGFLTSKKGSIRGKHYHKEQKQYTLVFSGKVRIVVKNLLENNSKLEILDLQKMEMILLPPFYYHSIEALEESQVLVFTSKSRFGDAYEDDTVRIDDIKSFKLIV